MCNTPEDLNLEGVDTVAIDIETYDPNLKTKGSGAIRNDGFVCGIAVATKNDLAYFPLRHSDTDISFDRASNEYLNLFSSITDAAIIVSTILPFIIMPVTALIQQTSYIAL